MNRRVQTPPLSIDAAAWIATLSPEDAAYIQGAAFQRMAIAANVTEAELYADFAKRAATDPDCQVVRI